MIESPQKADRKKKEKARNPHDSWLFCEVDTKKILLPNQSTYPNSHAFSIACSTSNPPAKTALIFSLDSTTTHSNTCRTSRSSYSIG